MTDDMISNQRSVPFYQPVSIVIELAPVDCLRTFAYGIEIANIYSRAVYLHYGRVFNRTRSAKGANPSFQRTTEAIIAAKCANDQSQAVILRASVSQGQKSK